MLDDDFKEIENFLKNGGNSELNTFQGFEKVIDDLIKNKLTNNIKENFTTLNVLVYHAYNAFDKNNSEVLKDFSTTIIVIKHLLAILKDTQDNDILNEKDKKEYIILMKILIDSMKQECESHLNFFNIFSEYLNDTNNLFNIDD